MHFKKLTITKASLTKDRRLSIREAGIEFFPKDAFGGNLKSKPGKAITLHIRSIKKLKTDIPTDTSGRPRWFFRDRTWVEDFVNSFKLKEGDKVNLIRLGEREYLLDAVPKKLTFIDLFAGIGGIRMAYESTDAAKCVFSSEWNKFAAETYKANFDEKPHGDITKIDAKDIPDHDILLAGFPCQPFSIAGVSKKNALGKAHGFKDETQGTLFFDIVRILEEKQPRAFMLENVRNLKSHDKGRTFDVIIKNLERLGYHVKSHIIDSSIVVPQMRKRIFIVGTKPAVNFEFPTEEELSKYRTARCISDILEKNVDPKYTLTEHLWTYLQNYKKKHRKAGNGFGFGLVGKDSIARTMSARYYKDGSEILVDQGKGKRPRMLTERECARLMGFPDTFKIPVSKTQAYKQFGNSVVVPVLKAIAHKLVNEISKNELINPMDELFSKN